MATNTKKKLSEDEKIRRANLISYIVVGVLLLGILVGVFFGIRAKRPVYVKMTIKDYGEVVMKLDPKSAPATVQNFKDLVKDGFYDGLTFHRIISNCIQGGDPKANGQGGSANKIKGEFLSNGWTKNKLSHVRGTVSMARATDMNSASSQFFICTKDSHEWDGDYAAFGTVVEGMEIVDKICTDFAAKATGVSGSIPEKKDQPVIESIVILNHYKK